MGVVEVDPAAQWCDRHWAHVLSTMHGPMPVNGMLATVRIFKEWMVKLADAMGNDFPTPEEHERAMSLLKRDNPLCCYVGDHALEAIYSTCIVPAKYRQMPLRYGHMLHMQEEEGGMVVEGQDVLIAAVVPPEVDPRLN